MLPRRYRLTRDNDFDRVHRNGRVSRGRLLFLKALPTANTDSRFVFLVGKKIHKSAVQLNRIRRRLRASAAALLPRISPGYDVVVLVQPRILTATQQEIQEELQQVLERAGLIVKTSV